MTTPMYSLSTTGAARLHNIGRDLASSMNVAPDNSGLAWTGAAAGPALHLDDVSAIPFLDGIPGVAQYQHRARVRATTGDLFAVSTPPTPGYEAYCRDTLGMGSPTSVTALPDGNPLEVANGCLVPEVLAQVVEFAKRAGRLTVHPYMGIESVWNLAELIRDLSNAPTEVLAPPPPVTWIANDKSSFANVVRAALGDTFLPEIKTDTTAAGLTDHVIELASRHDVIGLKRPRCASSMGNAIYSAPPIRAMNRAQVTDLVNGFLGRTEWPVGETVLVTEWIATDLSPSSQLWIPPITHGTPVVEGVYEQILRGEAKVFLGSRPSTIPAKVNASIAESALQVAGVLQGMGYVGRCSFDHLVLGDPHGDYRVVFTECNGRWGGTSTPMALVERLVAGPRPHYRAQDFEYASLVGATFDDILTKVGTEVFDANTQQGSFVFYNIGPLAEQGKLDVIALAESPERAEELILEVLPRLLGL